MKQIAIQIKFNNNSKITPSRSSTNLNPNSNPNAQKQETIEIEYKILYQMHKNLRWNPVEDNKNIRNAVRVEDSTRQNDMDTNLVNEYYNTPSSFGLNTSSSCSPDVNYLNKAKASQLKFEDLQYNPLWNRNEKHPFSLTHTDDYLKHSQRAAYSQQQRQSQFQEKEQEQEQYRIEDIYIGLLNVQRNKTFNIIERIIIHKQYMLKLYSFIKLCHSSNNRSQNAPAYVHVQFPQTPQHSQLPINQFTFRMGKIISKTKIHQLKYSFIQLKQYLQFQRHRELMLRLLITKIRIMFMNRSRYAFQQIGNKQTSLFSQEYRNQEIGHETKRSSTMHHLNIHSIGNTGKNSISNSNIRSRDNSIKSKGKTNSIIRHRIKIGCQMLASQLNTIIFNHFSVIKSRSYGIRPGQIPYNAARSKLTNQINTNSGHYKKMTKLPQRSAQGQARPTPNCNIMKIVFIIQNVLNKKYRQCLNAMLKSNYSAKNSSQERDSPQIMLNMLKHICHLCSLQGLKGQQQAAILMIENRNKLLNKIILKTNRKRRQRARVILRLWYRDTVTKYKLQAAERVRKLEAVRQGIIQAYK